MERNYTLGPWKAEPDQFNNLVIQASNGDLCTIFFTEFGDDNSDHDEPTEVQIANAHLIAAAPDLLEAVEYAMYLKDLWSADQYGSEDPVKYIQECKMKLKEMESKFEAAIAKALGREASHD